MTRKQRRLVLIGAAVGVLAIAAALVLTALRDSIVFFNSPTDVVEKHVGPGTRIRLGGLVQPGSVVRSAGATVRFDVTDGNKTIPVTYTGILPDLFAKGRALSPKAPSRARTYFVPTLSLPNTTRPTCPKRSRTH